MNHFWGSFGADWNAGVMLHCYTQPLFIQTPDDAIVDFFLAGSSCSTRRSHVPARRVWEVYSAPFS